MRYSSCGRNPLCSRHGPSRPASCGTSAGKDMKANCRSVGTSVIAFTWHLFSCSQSYPVVGDTNGRRRGRPNGRRCRSRNRFPAGPSDQPRRPSKERYRSCPSRVNRYISFFYRVSPRSLLCDTGVAGNRDGVGWGSNFWFLLFFLYMGRLLDVGSVNMFTSLFISFTLG